MIDNPQVPPYAPDPAIAEIADFIGDAVAPADFPQTILRFRNDRAAAQVGLDGLADDAWLQHFGRFDPLEGNLPHPLALRYHGHQFRYYNQDLGDGRGFLFAQMRDGRGRLMDLGTKGSGQTPWSRSGDGRLTLKGAVREILATEMLEALGVETSRTFSVVETGEALHRGDEPSPTRSAVLVRLSHGHIRIGSFQRLATLGDKANLSRLVTYTLNHYYGETAGEDGPIRLLDHVVRKTADLAASNMAAGFVHGVLNSDNINVSGESFDYGPWRWAETFDPRFTAAYFDESGLYAFGRQAEAIHWDVAQLAIALTSLVDQEALIPVLEQFGGLYREAVTRRMMQRLNLKPRSPADDGALVAALEQALVHSQVPLDRVYFDWVKGRADAPAGYDHAAFERFRQAWGAYDPAQPLEGSYWQRAQPCSMLIAEVEAIWQPIAETDDWSQLFRKVKEIREMGDAMRKIG